MGVTYTAEQLAAIGKNKPAAARLPASEAKALFEKPKRSSKPIKWQQPKQSESQQVHIGIDPGSVCTGFAMVNGSEPPILLGFKSHCEAILYALQVVREFGRENVHFIIEDARKAKTSGYFAKKNGSKKDQGVGYVKGLSKDWEMFCKRVAKVAFTLTVPDYNITKWPAKKFEAAYGIKTKENEHHLRDAFLLVKYKNAA